MGTMDTPSPSKPETVPGERPEPQVHGQERVIPHLAKQSERKLDQASPVNGELVAIVRLLARHAAQEYFVSAPPNLSASVSPRAVEEEK